MVIWQDAGILHQVLISRLLSSATKAVNDIHGVVYFAPAGQLVVG